MARINTSWRWWLVVKGRLYGHFWFTMEKSKGKREKTKRDWIFNEIFFSWVFLYFFFFFIYLIFLSLRSRKHLRLAIDSNILQLKDYSEGILSNQHWFVISFFKSISCLSYWLQFPSPSNSRFPSNLPTADPISTVYHTLYDKNITWINGSSWLHLAVGSNPKNLSIVIVLYIYIIKP